MNGGRYNNTDAHEVEIIRTNHDNVSLSVQDINILHLVIKSSRQL